ncbi:alkaline phosphatase family protein [Haliangium ochraceum]|uniref:Phospholipase C n=1 Tax=Haliangium ochraceum (strain DSM 14365 / JCM 11303 / SMP-2) TaxID=502025 RepID=D0LU24_HALO1|nr:alkaline phosphatase family protein [Haliangium ochraceum]ACY17388.1 Phospholipase C [Haliangium ochraceum DSM 14365]
MDIGEARDKIEHVIVLMLENRSFDHVLGSLSLREGRGDLDGLREEAQHGNFDASDHLYEVHPLAGNIHYGDRARRFRPDPPHGSEAVRMQIGRHMDGFVRAYQLARPDEPYPQSVLGYLTRAEQPITYALADNFVVCDRWFAAVPTGTIPNRMYSMAGHAQGYVDNPEPTSFFGVEGLETIFDYLPRHDGLTPGTGWRLYAQALSILHMFTAPGAALRHQRNIRAFARDVRENRLPKLSWLEPRYSWAEHLVPEYPGNDDHPPSDVMEGQRLIRAVVQTLFDNPAVWARSLLVITYDEHGGFYDHVKPPPIHSDERPTPSRFDDGFRQRGPRVPAILVSPFTQRRQAYHGIMDHCSILKFLTAWLDVPLAQPRVHSRHIDSVADAIPAGAPAAAAPPRLPPLPRAARGAPMAAMWGASAARAPAAGTEPRLDPNDDMVRLYRKTVEELRRRDPDGLSEVEQTVHDDGGI